jgi:hypothetical protein
MSEPVHVSTNTMCVPLVPVMSFALEYDVCSVYELNLPRTKSLGFVACQFFSNFRILRKLYDIWQHKSQSMEQSDSDDTSIHIMASA